jgi:hypothetical protein
VHGFRALEPGPVDKSSRLAQRLCSVEEHPNFLGDC